jgi:hypothetical protein
MWGPGSGWTLALTWSIRDVGDYAETVVLWGPGPGWTVALTWSIRDVSDSAETVVTWRPGPAWTVALTWSIRDVSDSAEIVVMEADGDQVQGELDIALDVVGPHLHPREEGPHRLLRVQPRVSPFLTIHWDKFIFVLRWTLRGIS